MPEGHELFAGFGVDDAPKTAPQKGHPHEHERRKTMPEKHIEIKIRLTPLFIERAAYSVAIVALLIMLIIAKVGGGDCTGTDATNDTASAATAMAAATSPPAGTSSSPGSTANTTPSTTTSQNTSSKTTPTVPASLSGRIDFVIEKVTSEAVSDTSGKIKSVDFTIKNGLSTALIPTINVYAWDDNLDDDDSTKYIDRGSWTFRAGVASGETKTGTVQLLAGTFVDPDKEKTVQLVLKGADGKVIKEVTKKVTIS